MGDEELDHVMDKGLSIDLATNEYNVGGDEEEENMEEGDNTQNLMGESTQNTIQNAMGEKKKVDSKRFMVLENGRPKSWEIFSMIENILSEDTKVLRIARKEFFVVLNDGDTVLARDGLNNGLVVVKATGGWFILVLWDDMLSDQKIGYVMSHVMLTQRMIEHLYDQGRNMVV